MTIQDIIDYLSANGFLWQVMRLEEYGKHIDRVTRGEEKYSHFKHDGAVKVIRDVAMFLNDQQYATASYWLDTCKATGECSVLDDWEASHV